MERRTLLTLTFVACLAASLAPSLALAQQPAGSAVESFPRVRLGLSLGGGVGSNGAAVDASVRAGVQVTRDVAVTYQLSGVETMNGILGSNFTSWASNAVLVEWTAPWPGLVLGVGPALTLGTANQGCGWFSDACTSRGFVDVGVDARAALVLGSYGTDARGGFTLQLAVHATPEAFASTVGIGFDLY